MTTVSVVRAAHYPRCAHKAYHMTCEQHEHLLTRSGACCEMCGASARHGETGLYLDHDHALGWRAVRGLVCPRCNLLIANVEAGKRKMDVRMEAYLANAWHREAGIVDYSCPLECRSGTHRRATAWTPDPDKSAAAVHPPPKTKGDAAASPLRIEYDGREALTIGQAAGRYGLDRTAARRAIQRLEMSGQVAHLSPAPISNRTPLYDAETLDAAMAARPGKGANLRGDARRARATAGKSS